MLGGSTTGRRFLNLRLYSHLIRLYHSEEQTMSGGRSMTFRYMLRHLWSRTIIRNMLFSYLGVNLLLLYLLSVVSIRGSTSAITEEVTASSYKVMQQAARGFNFNLEEAKRTLIQFAAHLEDSSSCRSRISPLAR